MQPENNWRIFHESCTAYQRNVETEISSVSNFHDSVVKARQSLQRKGNWEKSILTDWPIGTRRKKKWQLVWSGTPRTIQNSWVWLVMSVIMASDEKSELIHFRMLKLFKIEVGIAVLDVNPWNVGWLWNWSQIRWPQAETTLWYHTASF